MNLLDRIREIKRKLINIDSRRSIFTVNLIDDSKHITNLASDIYISFIVISDSDSIIGSENIEKQSQDNYEVIRCQRLSTSINESILKSKGDYIVLIDDSDIIKENATYEITKAAAISDADIIYSDEIYNNQKSFKPDYSPDTLLSFNYIGKLTAYKKAFIIELGGIRQGTEEALYYDLILRATECTDKIYHISKILCNTTVERIDENKEIEVIQDALERRGEGGVVKRTGYKGRYFVSYSPDANDFASIIIPTKDCSEILEVCLDSIFKKTTYENYEVIIIDNGSEKTETFNLFDYWSEKEPNRFKVIKLDIPFNFPKLNNEAVKYARGNILVFLNNDTEVITPDWLSELVGQARRKSIGAVSPVLLFGDNTIQHAGVILGIGKIGGRMFKYENIENNRGYMDRLICNYNYTALTAACMAVKKTDFLEVGGFDEKLVVTMNGIDLCLKLTEKGLYNLLIPSIHLYHYESKTRGRDDTIQKRQRALKEIKMLKEKWLSKALIDPMYNINLSDKSTDFSERYYFGEKIDLRIPSPKDNVKYKIDVMEVNENIIRICGWAVIEDVDSESSQIYITLKSKGQEQVYITKMSNRYDIVRFFSGQDMYKNSGFTLSIDCSKMKKGIYTVGLLIKNDKTYGYVDTITRFKIRAHKGDKY